MNELIDQTPTIPLDVINMTVEEIEEEMVFLEEEASCIIDDAIYNYELQASDFPSYMIDSTTIAAQDLVVHEALTLISSLRLKYKLRQRAVDTCMDLIAKEGDKTLKGLWDG